MDKDMNEKTQAGGNSEQTKPQQPHEKTAREINREISKQLKDEKSELQKLST